MPETDVVERLHSVETAQSVHATVQAGAAATSAATHAGMWTTMLAGRGMPGHWDLPGAGDQPQVTLHLLGRTTMLVDELVDVIP